MKIVKKNNKKVITTMKKYKMEYPQYPPMYNINAME